MLGFLFGIGVTLFVIRRFAPFGRSNWSRRRGRRDFLLDRLGSRLDTTPSQDKVLAEVIDDLFDAFGEERAAFKGARGRLAEVLRSESFDAESLAAMKGEHEASLGRVHRTASDALRRAHEALDPDQREQLAAMLERGHRRHHHCHGRRHLHAA